MTLPIIFDAPAEDLSPILLALLSMISVPYWMDIKKELHFLNAVKTVPILQFLEVIRSTILRGPRYLASGWNAEAGGFNSRFYDVFFYRLRSLTKAWEAHSGAKPLVILR